MASEKQEPRCEWCKHNAAQDLHTCPYKEEINDDHESLCDCCEECAHECAMDV